MPALAGHGQRAARDSIWSSFGISRMQMPWVAQSILLGGNVRVGLEDNLYLSKRRLCQQRAVGGKGAHHHRSHGCPDHHSGAGSGPAQVELSGRCEGAENLLDGHRS